MEVKNIFMTKDYDIADAEKVSIKRSCWTDWASHLIEILATEIQEICKISA